MRAGAVAGGTVLGTPFFSIDEARAKARRRLPRMVFDYIDGAAGTETGEAMNRAAWQAVRLRQRALVDVQRRDLAVSLFGRDYALPFGIAPMGMCNLARPGTDEALARAAARHRIPIGVSTVASTSLERMAEWADGHAWFQLYIAGTQDEADGLVDRAAAAGYEVLVLTVDTPVLGLRVREQRHGFTHPFNWTARAFLDCALHPFWSLPTLLAGAPELGNFDGQGGPRSQAKSGTRAGVSWETLARLRERWAGRLVVKGVTDAEDAARLALEGADAIQVSSHGGRQLDGGVLPARALPAIRAAVPDATVLTCDSGLRSGEDVVRAHAMGASMAFLGRPFQYAAAAAGADGIETLIAMLREEVSITLGLLGRTTMELGPDVIAEGNAP